MIIQECCGINPQRYLINTSLLNAGFHYKINKLLKAEVELRENEPIHKMRKPDFCDDCRQAMPRLLKNDKESNEIVECSCMVVMNKYVISIVVGPAHAASVYSV